MFLVSIICSVYNGAAFIQKTIESVQNQTYKNWEFLVTDDASTDGTFDIVRKFAVEDPRIKIERFSINQGPAVGRNASIDRASGRFIAFLDADDLWLPNKLEKQISFMLSENVDLSYAAYYIMNEDGKRTGKIISAKPALSYKVLLNNNYIGCLTAVYDTERLGKVYLPLIKKRQDWALWLQISKMTASIKGLNIPLAEYRLRSKSISSNKFALLKYNWNVYRKIENFSFARSSYLITKFLIFYFLKKI